MSFIRATAIRALRTAAQVAIGAIGSAAAFSDVRWDVVAGTVALSAILSVLSSIATGLPETTDGPETTAYAKAGPCEDCDDNAPHGANPELDEG